VAGLLSERPPELQDTAWGYVYDPYILYCSWRVAAAEPVWNLPSDIDRLVQAVYSHDPFVEEDRPELMATLDRALGDHYAKLQEQRQLALNVAIHAEDEPQSAYQQKPRADEDCAGTGIAVVTRLGQDSITIVPVHASDDGWRLLATDTPFDPREVPDDGLARRIFARQLRVSRKGLVQTLRAEPAPPVFDEHPLLRNIKPLELRAGEAKFGSLLVRLDPQLGLVYETPPQRPEGA
jgi:CRISPR-associated endonuclease/helicase Cas3